MLTLHYVYIYCMGGQLLSKCLKMVMWYILGVCIGGVLVCHAGLPDICTADSSAFSRCK